jgi:uncharacterized protein (TIGR03067 family)
VRVPTLLILPAVLLLGFAPAPFPRPHREADLARLQGTWDRLSYRLAGGDHTGTVPVHARIVNDRITYFQKAVKNGECVFTLDATRRPKVFDSVGLQSKNHYKGIYQLEGDTLTICSVTSKVESERPTAFTGELAGHHLEVYKRRKP